MSRLVHCLPRYMRSSCKHRLSSIILRAVVPLGLLLIACTSMPRSSANDDQALEPEVRPEVGLDVALSAAVKLADYDEVKLLLAKGANPNSTFSDGQTLIESAAAKGYLEITKLLLDAGADPDISSPFVSALCGAIIFGHVEVTKTLIDGGADVNLVSRDGTRTPLGCAAGSRDAAPSIELLLLAGADIEMGNPVTGVTPLMKAISCAMRARDNYEKCMEHVRVLLLYGADIHAIDKGGHSVIDHVLLSLGAQDPNDRKEHVGAMLSLLVHWGARPTQRVTEWITEMETMEIFRAAAPAILTCFHPGTTSLVTANPGAYEQSTYGGVLEGEITMRGILDTYSMMVTLHYDRVDEKILVSPGRENTLAPASRKCKLRSWTPLRKVNDAAKEARSQFTRDVTLAAVAVAGVALDSKIGQCVADLAVDEFIGTIEKKEARIAAMAAWRAVRGQSGREVAADVAVSEMMRILERESPDVSAALKGAGFVQCLLKEN